MRKITRQLVLLFVVFVIYFGYSAFVDGAALFHITDTIDIKDAGGAVIATIGKGVTIDSAAWNGAGILYLDGAFGLREGLSAVLKSTGATVQIGDYIAGLMAPTSLLYTILTPFKLVLVGGVFAMLVPLTKSIFFGTFIGIKNYIIARRSNILFNYQAAIAFATDMSAKIATGDYEQIKALYGPFNLLKFKPMFLQNMMDEIADTLIREADLKPYIKSSEAIVVGLKEMYEKERQAAIAMRPSEMFFDFKRGYEYISIGSRYCISYYKALETKDNTQIKLGWKLFSLEMYKFYVYMLFSIIPTIILSVIVLPLIGSLGSGAAAQKTAPALIIVSLFVFSIIFHACFTLTKPAYRNMLKTMVTPAVVYYVLILVLSVTFALGVNGLIAIGTIVAPGTAVPKMWSFFAALGYTILSTCLILYIIATLMDSNRNPLGMTKKVIIDGMILPAIAWCLSTGLNFVGILVPSFNMGTWSGVSLAVLIIFWIYLSISGLLLNNIILPSNKKKLAIQKTLENEGNTAQAKAKAKPKTSTKPKASTKSKSTQKSKK